jgi:diguanylate cyclase (GGDEF)-like protein
VKIYPDGKLIRELREARGWTQKELAERTGWSKKTIENSEAGRSVRLNTLTDIAEALGVLMIRLVLAIAHLDSKPGSRARSADPQIDPDLDAAEEVKAMGPAALPPSPQPAEWPRKPTLLVVDDDERDTIHTIFRKLKDEYTVYTAKSADEAERILDANDITAIIADQRMPGCTGVELLKSVRSRSPRTIRLLMTGHQEFDALEAAINEAGIYHFVRKGCPVHELRQILLNAKDKFDLERRYDRLVLELGRLNDQLEKRVAARTQELEKLTITDPLTSLLNRRGLDQQVDQAVKHRNRYSNALALAYVDLDNFKHVNTTFGYLGGDAVLVAIAQVLSSVVREADMVARAGGDEFIALATNTDAVGAEQLGNRILTAIATTITPFKGQNISLTASAGFAVAGHGVPATYEELRRVASAAVQKAKDAGRNQCIIQTL